MRRRLKSRTRSGRISRAGKPREAGTPELQAKRRALVGENADPALSTAALDIMYARGQLTQEQRDSGIRYRFVRSCLYGSPWPVKTTPGTWVEEARIKALQSEFDGMVSRLTAPQRAAVDHVSVLDHFPDNDQVRSDLIAGLNMLASGTKPHKRTT